MRILEVPLVYDGRIVRLLFCNMKACVNRLLQQYNFYEGLKKRDLFAFARWFATLVEGFLVCVKRFVKINR